MRCFLLECSILNIGAKVLHYNLSGLSGSNMAVFGE